ncbi:hypothetical protein [Chelativorans salis]|uniref:EamA domain-containing protein n=1 Tax=Chelativorans salis TaxID=2978478 RepID=A0ABT2LRX5_9HYPH|nr:hypothetical protein [Chelativorans sp. EGI FJ00035]MCT7376859.1 hypothetical protein [Chelativorans sp. EGI FJ00035]
MLLWALIVGLSFPAVALMSEGLPPLFLTALRFAIAALALGDPRLAGAAKHTEMKSSALAGMADQSLNRKTGDISNDQNSSSRRKPSERVV